MVLKTRSVATSHNILLNGHGEAVIADFGESGFLKRNPTVADSLTMQPGVRLSMISSVT
jgi:hypothetical protein